MIWALLIFVVLVVLVILNRIGQKTYVAKVLLALDYLVSCLWDRNFDLTISSQCGLYWRTGHAPWFWWTLHELLDALQKNHCELAIIGDLTRAQATIKLLSALPSGPAPAIKAL
jgi:hypothetical protein